MMFENSKDVGREIEPEFENDLHQDPTLKSQILNHLPVALLAVGIAGTMMALHLAITGVIALALTHVLVGAIMLAARRHRTSASTGPQA